MTGNKKVRILVVEDNTLTRLGILSLLRTQGDFEIVGESSDGSRAVSLYRELRPDIMILDLKLPSLDGVGVTTAVLNEDAKARVLILSHYDADEQIFQAVRAGAKGYLTKETEGDRIFDAVRVICAGGTYLPPDVAEKLAQRIRRPTLTRREQQILEHIQPGNSNRQIAEAVGIAEKTVGIYVGNILSKLGARSRGEAVSIAISYGLLTR